MKAATSFIEVQNLRKSFVSQGKSIEVLKGINLTIQQGEFVGIVGKSGSGKSTLLNMLTTIDQPTSGSIMIGKKNIHQSGEAKAARWRGNHVGIVFQFFQLLPTLSVLDNVVLPMDFLGTMPFRQRKSRALALLDNVGMKKHAYKLPSRLSGGEQQRVAIARSLANDPEIIVADEPTGNLDTETSQTIYEIFQNLVHQGKTVLMVTHDKITDLKFTQVITLTDGLIAENKAFTQNIV